MGRERRRRLPRGSRRTPGPSARLRAQRRIIEPRQLRRALEFAVFLEQVHEVGEALVLDDSIAVERADLAEEIIGLLDIAAILFRFLLQDADRFLAIGGIVPPGRAFLVGGENARRSRLFRGPKQPPISNCQPYQPDP